MRYGNPFIHNLTPEDYNNHPQNWAIIQDNDGIMYFGNNQDVIEFDGTSYRNIPVIGTRCFGKDNEGIIYVGADNELGYIQRDSTGNNKYYSLVDSLPDADKDFYIVLSIINHNNKIYFVGFKKILIFENKHFVKSIKTENDFRFGFKVRNRIFVKETGVGICEIKNDTLYLIQSSAFLADQSVYFILPMKNDKFLLGTRNMGLYTMTTDDAASIEAFKTDADDYLIKKTIYHGLELNDTLIAIVTNDGGMVFINDKGELITMITTLSGLNSNALNYAYIDREKNLWLASNNGISYVEINTPITGFKESDGIHDLSVDFIKYKKELYIGTLQNLYKLQNKTQITENDKSNFWFQQIAPLNDSYMHLEKIDNLLIGATRAGVVQYNGTQIKFISNAFQNYNIVRSKIDSNILFVGNSQGILKFKKLNSQWIEQGYHLNIGDEIRYFIELPDGEFVFVTNNTKLTRTKTYKDSIELHPIELKNLRKTKQQISYSIYTCGNKEYLIANNQIFYYDFEQDQFNKITNFPVLYHGDTIRYKGLYQGHNHSLWTNTNLGIGWLKKDSKEETYTIDFKPLARLSKSDIFLIYDDTLSHEIWISNSKGVFCYNYLFNIQLDTAFNTLIRTVSIFGDTIVLNGNSDHLEKAINYSGNSISFQFSSPFYTNHKALEYSYYLDGFDREWSDWSNETKAVYTNLPAGSYVFKVKAKNYLDIESKTAEYSFFVLSPWYMKWWAYIIYLIVLILLIYFVVYVNSKRLKAINFKLEKIIQQRTREIQEKNLTLETQNKLITDSINYAKHIQDAILTNPEKLKMFFNDAFVLYKPRDIVSGDFYWFSEQKDNYFIAVGDCTGHGVPGALMSMMGNTLLNQIVNEKHVYNPASILTKLNENVRLMLQQDSQDENNRQDGMDISMIKYDKQSKIISIASANHKVIIIQDGKIKHIDGDIYSIGGLFSENNIVVFNTIDIQHENDTMIYMFSDGFYDQFGGPNKQKYMLSRFEEFIYKNHSLTLEKQKRLLESELIAWKGSGRQIDDILIIGIKI